MVSFDGGLDERSVLFIVVESAFPLTLSSQEYRCSSSHTF